MARLTDPEKLACFINALANWRYEGFIILTDMASEWMNLHLEGFSTRTLGKLMYDHVTSGGEIDQTKETRPEWNVHDFHYDIRIPVTDRVIYIETRLIYSDASDPDDPVIHV